MSASTLSADRLRPPQSPALGRGFGLALLAHALLVVGLSLGVQWHTQSEPAFEAELWSLVPQAAAPRLQEPEPEPEPEPVAPKVKTPPPVPEAQPEQRDADIAIAREKKRKEEERRQAELELQRKKELEKERQKEREKLKEQERQKKDDLARQEKLEKQKQEKAAREAQAKVDELRRKNLERMMGMAGATGSPGSTGTAQHSSGPSATYAGRIKAAIRPNIIYTVAGSGNPQAEVEVRCAPDGKIISSRLTKSSGDADWDRAVLRAIERTDRLPRDTDGRVPPELVITFKPNE